MTEPTQTAVDLDRRAAHLADIVRRELAALADNPVDVTRWRSIVTYADAGLRAATARAELDTPPPDMRYPDGRPGWLGTGQPWPCGRCGAEVDDESLHDCRRPAHGRGSLPHAYAEGVCGDRCDNASCPAGRDHERCTDACLTVAANG